MRKTRPVHDGDGHLTPAGFVLGRDRFAQISAVEGIGLTADMRAALDRFDREGLDAENQRDIIIKRFTPAR